MTIIKKSLQIINSGEDVEKREPSWTVGGNVNCCSHYVRIVWRFLKKLKTELTYDAAIPLLGKFQRKTWSKRIHAPPVFTEALLTIAETWKQPKCPLTKEWIKKTWYICTMEYYWAIKKEWNNAICSNMDGTRDCHTEWSKSDREGEISYGIPYMQNVKRNDTKELIHKRETGSQT